MNRTSSLLAGLRRRVRDWWAGHARLRELDHFDGRDLERVLQDLNVTKSEMAEAVTRGAYPRLLLSDMLQAHGLHTDRLTAEYPEIETDLRRVCAQCPETNRCRRELKAHSAATNYHEFCCNSLTLEALGAKDATNGEAVPRHSMTGQAAQKR